MKEGDDREEQSFEMRQTLRGGERSAVALTLDLRE